MEAVTLFVRQAMGNISMEEAKNIIFQWKNFTPSDVIKPFGKMFGSCDAFKFHNYSNLDSNRNIAVC